jgi:hypothetical protein
MWAEIIKRLPDYQSAVITGVTVQGYPSSVRCKPQPEAATQVLKIQIPDGTDIQPGPASLLCHKHDEQFWNLQSFVACGTLEQRDGGWVFHPERFTPGAAMDVLSFVRFVRDSRRTARQYLEKRHLPRPKVPWNEIKALCAEVEKTPEQWFAD